MVDLLMLLLEINKNSMKKLNFLLVLVFITSISLAQDIRFIEGLGFSSIFQNSESGIFKGKVSGIVQLGHRDSTIESYSFAGNDAVLNIIPDKAKIYDISFKEYSCETSNMKFSYTTYNRSNSLSVYLNGSEFSTTLIDGACELIFTDLDYKYFDDGDAELLLLIFGNDIGLSPGGCNGTPEIFIKRGSTMVFSIARGRS